MDTVDAALSTAAGSAAASAQVVAHALGAIEDLLRNLETISDTKKGKVIKEATSIVVDACIIHSISNREALVRLKNLIDAINSGEL